MSSAFTRVTIVRSDATPVLIASALLTNPPRTPHVMETRARTILADYNVGTIVNCATDVKARDSHHRMYRDLNIEHVRVAIDDRDDVQPPSQFFGDCIRAYEQHCARNVDRAILFNCQMGVNRSALAAGCVLWYSTVPQRRQWSSAQELVQHMRVLQRQQRNVFLLTNSAFEQALIQWCAA